MRVSLWFLYIAVCGLLCLFLLLKNAGKLRNQLKSESQSGNFTSQSDEFTKEEIQVSILSNKGELVLLYLGGVLLMTLLFFSGLK